MGVIINNIKLENNNNNKLSLNVPNFIKRLIGFNYASKCFFDFEAVFYVESFEKFLK